MPVKSLFGKTYRLLETSLDIVQKRQGLIASNIANVSTPGFRTKDLPFEKTLENELEKRSVHPVRTNPRHFGVPKNGGRGNYEIVEENQAGVDIDKEMARLAENNLRYQAGVEVLLRKFNGLKHAITEGGR